MDGGYPALSDIVAYLGTEGIEEITEGNCNFRQEFLQFLWAILNRTSFAGALGVWCPTPTTFNVRGGKYTYKGIIKTYTPGAAVDPTDNDTTYIWLNSDNTIGSGIDGNGWPTTEHIKLAEIDVDSDGNITDVRDMRGQTFMQYLANYIMEAASSVEALPVHWDSSSPADNDELRLPIYAENDASEKTEFVRRVVKLVDVSDGSETAEYAIELMVAGVLTERLKLDADGIKSPNIITPMIRKNIEAHTADDTLTAAESGSVHTNLGAAGVVTLTLPSSAPAGTVFDFAVQAAQELRIEPGVATIRDDSGQAAGKYKYASAIGACITLVADANGDWVTIAKNGTWTEEI